MICGYHEYISKLLLENEMDLQYQYPYLDPYAKQIKVQCAHFMLQKQENWQKKLANCCDLPNSPKFFPLQSFLLYGNMVQII